MTKRNCNDWLKLANDTAAYFLIASVLQETSRVPKYITLSVWVSWEHGVHVEYHGEDVDATIAGLLAFVQNLGKDYFFGTSYLPLK